MKTKVTEEGVLIPRDFLEGIDEVEIRQEQGGILVIPITANDPILQLGMDPIAEPVDDASEQHDRYLYNV